MNTVPRVEFADAGLEQLQSLGLRICGSVAGEAWSRASRPASGVGAPEAGRLSGYPGQRVRTALLADRPASKGIEPVLSFPVLR